MSKSELKFGAAVTQDHLSSTPTEASVQVACPSCGLIFTQTAVGSDLTCPACHVVFTPPPKVAAAASPSQAQQNARFQRPPGAVRTFFEQDRAPIRPAPPNAELSEGSKTKIPSPPQPDHVANRKAFIHGKDIVRDIVSGVTLRRKE